MRKYFVYVCHGGVEKIIENANMCLCLLKPFIPQWVKLDTLYVNAKCRWRKNYVVRLKIGQLHWMPADYIVFVEHIEAENIWHAFCKDIFKCIFLMEICNSNSSLGHIKEFCAEYADSANVLSRWKTLLKHEPMATRNELGRWHCVMMFSFLITYIHVEFYKFQRWFRAKPP